MDTVHVAASPSLDVSVSVIRTANSIYLISPNDDESMRLTLVWSHDGPVRMSWAPQVGESFEFDPTRGTVPHIGERWSVVKPDGEPLLLTSPIVAIDNA